MSVWDAGRYKWAEVWIEDSTPYFLVLGARRDGELEVYDPIEKRIAFSTRSYDDARLWLNEDEFIRVDGRMELDAKQ